MTLGSLHALFPSVRSCFNEGFIDCVPAWNEVAMLIPYEFARMFL